MDRSITYFTGRIASPPKLEKTPNGQDVCTFDAVSLRQYVKGTKTLSRSCFTDVVAFGEFARRLASATVNTGITIRGHLEKRQRRERGGESFTELVIDYFETFQDTKKLPAPAKGTNTATPINGGQGSLVGVPATYPGRA